ncbi:MAG: hypothetical protein Kow0022_17780 [Phycisphaerales bacterium]
MSVRLNSAEMSKLTVAALCPLFALFGVRLWLEARGPSVASAQMAAEEIVVPRYEPLPPLSEAQSAMRERVRALEVMRTLAPNPFPATHRPELMLEDLAPAPIQLHQEPEGVAVEPPPEVVVTAVMGGRVPVAVINGRPRSVGEEVQPGWSVLKITPTGVVLGHSDGRTVTIGIQRGTP